MAVDEQPDGTTTFSVIDRWRLPLSAAGAAFAIVTIAVAGWRGVRSLVALALALVLAIRVLIPLAARGLEPARPGDRARDPDDVVSFVLTQGLNRTTSSPRSSGTIAGLLITGSWRSS